MLAKDQNGVPILVSKKALDKAREIKDKILKTAPHLARELPPDSILNQDPDPTQNGNTVQMPSIKRADNPKDSKKKGSTMGNHIIRQGETVIGGIGGLVPNVMNPNSFGNSNKADWSVVRWQKEYNELENKYFQLQDQMKVLQHDKEEKEHRYVKREAGYRKLVDELHEELRRDFSLSGGERKRMEEIAGLHEEILDKINNIQLRTSKVLMDQEKDIIRFFNNKINEIKKQFEEERIRRGKKDQSYEVKEKQLIAELEWIKDIAQKIDQENHTLMKKYMDLKAQFSTQENDREILLREVLMKKKKNAILKSQIDHYEKVLEDVSKDKNGQNSFLGNEFPDKIADPLGNLGQTLREQDGNGMNMSRTGSAKRQSGMFSAEKNPRAQTATLTNFRAESVINRLKIALQKEKKKVQQLKTLYIKELESKSVLEKVLRACIEDIKDDIFTAQKERTSNRKLPMQNELLDQRERASLVEKLINDERILTLIYDKTFYANNKKIEIPPELLQDDEDEAEDVAE